MKRNPNVIWPGDWVEIVDPRVVKRVGYPKSVDDYKVIVRDRFSDQLAAIFPHTRLISVVAERAQRRVIHEIAYMLAKEDGFGGPDRTIHLEERPDLRGRTCQVTEIKTCMTGRYYAPSSWRDSYGESDFESGGLANQHCHRLLCINTGEWISCGKIWIPASHVKKP